MWEIARKYSYGSSANNHLIGELAGVYIGASYFSSLRIAAELRGEAWRRLAEQLFAQTNPDGGDKEQTTSYHLFVAQFFLLAGLVSRWMHEDFDAAYWERLEKMFEFIAVLSEGGPCPPAIGDSDDGYVLDLGGGANDWRGWLNAASCIFERPYFRPKGDHGQPAWWLLGKQAYEASRAYGHQQVGGGAAARLTSKALADTGYYVLQSSEGAICASAVIDCGDLGFGAIAGHGHADALSLCLRLAGQDVLVDPGTYDYFTYPAWREFFRSTRAHNTVEVDGENQSQMQGLFLWGNRARARCINWSPGSRGGSFVGEHDGYTRLADPVIHRRSLELDAAAGRMLIEDELLGRQAHQLAIWYNFARGSKLVDQSGSTLIVRCAQVLVRLQLDSRLICQAVSGDAASPAGWVSGGYHSKVPAIAIVGRCTFERNIKFRSRISWNAVGDGG